MSTRYYSPTVSSSRKSVRSSTKVTTPGQLSPGYRYPTERPKTAIGVSREYSNYDTPTYGSLRRERSYVSSDHYNDSYLTGTSHDDDYDVNRGISGLSLDPYSSRVQSQVQRQRSLEASKQMVYGVFGNVLAILEEFESRKRGRSNGRLPGSRIPIPSQAHKSEDDIRAILETQLLLFEHQCRACPSEVIESMRKQLKQRTLQWASVRTDHGCREKDTDRYVAQLYEILAKGTTDHAFHTQPRPRVTADTMREVMPHIFYGKHAAAQLDDDFRRNQAQRATCPDVRPGSARRSARKGADRIRVVKSYLSSALDDDVDEFDDVDLT